MEFDLSFLYEQRIPASTEINLAEIQKVLTEATVAETIIVKPPSWMVKNWYGKGKGKEVAEDVLCGFKPYGPEIKYDVVNKEELLVAENSILLDWTLNDPDPRVTTISSKIVYTNPSEWVVKPDLTPIWISLREDKDDQEIVGSSEKIVVEDIDVEKLKEEEIIEKELKRKMNVEKDLVKKVENAMKREVIMDRLEADKEFKLVFDRLCLYYKEKCEDVFYESPEEVIAECFKKDCERIVQVVHDSYKLKPDDRDQIMVDWIADVSTLPLAKLKEYLRRYGFISYQINKMSVEAMVREAKKVQLSLLKKLRGMMLRSYWMRDYMMCLKTLSAE